MARTDVSIVNIALSRMGSSTIITSLSDTTDIQAIQANLIYTETRDALLREYPWRFATRHIKLEQNYADINQSEFLYSYCYPDDCLRILKIYSEGNEKEDGREEHEIYSIDCYNDVRIIATDVEDAYADYIAQITDPELFDPNFASCLAWRLAAEFAVVFSRDFARRNELYKVYEIEIETARALDMSEGYKRIRNKRNKYASAR